MFGITMREAWSIIHGAGFGFLLLLLFPALIFGLYLLSRGWLKDAGSGLYPRLLAGGAWLASLAVWLTDLTGTFLSYPWYRRQPPGGTVNLRGFPKFYLLSRPHLEIWENVGMKFKEYLGWSVPFLCTAAAYIILAYGRRLFEEKEIRKALPRA